ncbi:MAG: beta-lactamase family protein [Caldilinea sp.]|nr:beta-lactamase family protein [Caldilinea sp.]
MPHLPPPTFDEAGRADRIAAALPELDAIAAEFANKHKLPALAYGVVAGGSLVHGGATGWADIAAQQQASATTLFRIASMTKSFAALAVLQLRDAGALALDDRADAYVPELASLVYPTADAPAITLRHLLTMSAGWPEDNAWGDRQLALDDASFSALLARGVPFASAPGTQYEYSNLGYMVLGRVVSCVAGMPFQQYVNERILAPLGMTQTCWNVDSTTVLSVARGHEEVDGAWVEEPLAWMRSAGDTAAFGGLYTTVEELARWVALFLSAWPPREGDEPAVLRRASLREMQQAATARPPWLAGTALGEQAAPEAGGYGFGLFAGTAAGLGRIVQHAGGLPGFGSHMAWLPDRDLGVVAFANRTYAPAVPIALDLLRHVVTRADAAPRRVHPAPALTAAREGATRLLQRWNDDLADALVADNFFLDLSRERWQQRVARLRTLHGDLVPEGEIEIDNPLRCSWRLCGERGWCNVSLTLAPTMPPRIQEIEIASVLPPDAAMQAALDGLLALIAAPTLRGVGRLFARGVDRAAMRDRLRLVQLSIGPCALDAITGGDGSTRTVARLAGTKGRLIATVTLDRLDGKIRSAEFRMVE